MYENPQTTSTAITEYEPIAAALASVEKFRGLVCDVTTPQGMAEAKAAHREVAAIRIALEKTRKKVKEDVLARGKLIDDEAKVIGAKVAAIEDPIKQQIDAEERREEEQRQAAILAEQNRLATIERERKEAEEAELARQRAEIARAQAEIASKQAALEAEQKAAHEKAEAEERARLNRIAEEDRARQAKIDAIERASKQRIADAEEKARKQRQAEEDRQRAERKRLDDAQRTEREREAAEARAREDAERKVREEQEAVEREEKRQAAEQLDAVAMLDTFVERFGHLRQFSSVTKAIKALSAKQARKAA